MTEKTASVQWEALVKKGRGQISTEPRTLERDLFGVACRFEECALAAVAAEAAAAEANLK